MAQRDDIRRLNNGLEAQLKAKGMVFNTIAAPEQARMRSAVKAVHEKFAASYDPTVVKLFTSELERVSKL